MLHAILVALLLASLLVQSGCQKDARPVARAEDVGKRLADKELGSFQPVQGTSYLVAPIQDREPSGQGGSGSWLSSGYTDAYRTPHNYVFLEQKSLTFSRLLPVNDWTILTMTAFPERGSWPDAAPIAWFLYEIVKSDTNGDKKLNWIDRKTVAISDAAGQNYTELISDVAAVHTKVLRDPATMLVIYRGNGALQLARIDLKARQVESTVQLPDFGPDVR
jgi:hypothetical protein